MLWLALILGVIGGFIYIADKKIKAKFEDKFNPTDWDLPRSLELAADVKPQAVAAPATAVKLSYTKKSSIFTDTQRTIFNALQQAVAGEYILLANINVADVLSIGASNNVLAVQIATKNLAAKQFDFLVCDTIQLTPVCAIMLGDSLESLLVSCCEEAQLPLARFKIQSNYDVAVIRGSLLTALGRTDVNEAATYESALEITDAVEATSAEQKTDVVAQIPSQTAGLSEGGINLELCPECSAVMLKRKAKTGAAAGKLFWICSTYPKCRGMLPVK